MTGQSVSHKKVWEQQERGIMRYQDEESGIRKYQEVSRYIYMYQDVSGCIKMYQYVSRCIKIHQDVSSIIDCINGNYNIIWLVRDIETVRYCDIIILQYWSIEILRC